MEKMCSLLKGEETKWGNKDIFFSQTYRYCSGRWTEQEFSAEISQENRLCDILGWNSDGKQSTE